MIFSASDKQVLRDIACASIRHGLAYGRALAINPAELAAALQRPAASFVTLETAGELRGCIGTLEAHRALAVDVSENAFAAAFRDARFPPLRRDEFDAVELHISVLTPPEILRVRDEADLLAKLRPGIDGIVLTEGSHRGTFLPSVWEQLPAPADFLAHLKRKAGIAASHWSAAIKVERYTSEEF